MKNQILLLQHSLAHTLLNLIKVVLWLNLYSEIFVNYFLVLLLSFIGRSVYLGMSSNYLVICKGMLLITASLCCLAAGGLSMGSPHYTHMIYDHIQQDIVQLNHT